MRRTSLIALGVGAAITTAIAGAAVAPQAHAADTVQCFGISKAGENDCANKVAGHSCAGQSKVDYDGMDFKAVTKDECTKMGGKLEAFEGVNQNVKM